MQGRMKEMKSDILLLLMTRHYDDGYDIEVRWYDLDDDDM